MISTMILAMDTRSVRYDEVYSSILYTITQFIPCFF